MEILPRLGLRVKCCALTPAGVFAALIVLCCLAPLAAMGAVIFLDAPVAPTSLACAIRPVYASSAFGGHPAMLGFTRRAEWRGQRQAEYPLRSAPDGATISTGCGDAITSAELRWV